MKTKYLITLTIALITLLSAHAQEPLEINGFRVIEIDGDYFDISGNDTLKIVSDVITVKYHSAATEQQIQDIEQTHGLEKTYHAPTGWINYQLDGNSDVVDVLQQLNDNPLVSEVLFSRHIPFFISPNEQSWTEFTWDAQSQSDICLDNGGEIPWDDIQFTPKNLSHVLMEVDLAWEITTGSPDIIIGFIDTGIYADHEDLGLGNDSYHNLWEHPVTGNHGWNFFNGNANLTDSHGHGTILSSIACAKTNNNIGAFGVAGGWGSEGAKAMTLKTDCPEGYLVEHLAPTALFYALDFGARIINMSFGSDDPNYHYQPLADAIETAYNEFNCILFAAVGNFNNDFISFPASHEYTIAVGATEISCVWLLPESPPDPPVYAAFEQRWGAYKGKPHPASHIGEEIDLVAPSYSYFATIYNHDDYSHEYTMTSGATAYASGIAALILSANPCLTNDEVAEIMKSTADKIDADNQTPEAQYDPVTGHSLWYGYGRINAHQAVLAALDKLGEPATSVTSNESWDSPMRFSGDITVENGAVLTLTSILYMDALTRIIVKPGGKLIIDGAKITTACFEPWRGIEVWGDYTMSQYPDQQGNMHQGMVIAKNGAVIEYAEIAILASRRLPEEDPRSNEPVPPDLAFNGGIVIADTVSFINNKTGVVLAPYENFYPTCQTIRNNFSSVKNSEFIVNHMYLKNMHPGVFINLNGVRGISVHNNDFINMLHDPSEVEVTGILSHNAIFHVNKTSSGLVNHFRNLKYGIRASANTPTRHVDIRKAVFENNFRGIYLSGISNARVTSNDFVINTPFEEDGGYGLYLDACNGYWVEDNEFETANTTATGVGIIVNDSGDDPNEIYRNRFIKLEQGISAQGYNRDPLTNNGLQILCNDFMNTGADILVANPYGKIAWGIAAWQGDSTYMAGNLFHHHAAVDYNDINNEGEHITYFVPANYDPQYFRVIPEEYTGNTVTVIQIPFNPPWSYGDKCPCKLESSGGVQTEELKQQMAESELQADGLQESLDLMIDDGDTEGLHWDVQMSTSPQAMQVYDELMGTSPWLSDTVVSASIIKEDVLVDAMLRDIMVANPHTAKSDQLMEELDQRWTPLPEYMKAQILQGKSTVSAREHTEASLAKQRLNKARAVNSLARIWHDDADSLVWLWEGDNSLASKYKLAFLHLELGQATHGTSVLNNIPVQMNLSAARQAVHQQITAVYDILASLAQEGKSILEADSLQIITLLDIEEEANGIAGVYARNALLALQRLAYDEPILLPDLMKSRVAAEAYRKLLETKPPKNLGVFPIPARDYIVVDFRLDAETKGVVEFTDATGRLVHTLKVSGPFNQELIDTRQWKPGWYIATLKTQVKTLDGVKFIISD